MIILVGAHGQNYEMGKDGRLPWEDTPIQADIEKLHSLTANHTVVVGERTYREYKDIQTSLNTEKIIVVSRSVDELPDAEVASDLQELIKRGESEDLWVIGGASLFAQLLSSAKKMYLTRVEADFEADVFFPKYPVDEWEVVQTENFPADEHNAYPYTFLELTRKS